MLHIYVYIYYRLPSARAHVNIKLYVIMLHEVKHQPCIELQVSTYRPQVFIELKSTCHWVEFLVSLNQIHCCTELNLLFHSIGIISNICATRVRIINNSISVFSRKINSTCQITSKLILVSFAAAVFSNAVSLCVFQNSVILIFFTAFDLQGTGSCSSFTTGASLYWKSQFLWYGSESVLEVATSVLQVRGCIGSCSFFMTGASLYWKWQFLHYRSESVLEVAISSLQEPVWTGSINFFTTGASL